MSASNAPKPTHPIDVALEFTKEVIDQVVYSSFSDCSNAVHELIGNDFGGGLFDVSPLHAAYMEFVTKAAEFEAVDDVQDVAKKLLKVSLDKAKLACEFKRTVNAKEFNSVGVLASFMRAASTVFLTEIAILTEAKDRNA